MLRVWRMTAAGWSLAGTHFLTQRTLPAMARVRTALTPRICSCARRTCRCWRYRWTVPAWPIATNPLPYGEDTFAARAESEAAARVVQRLPGPVPSFRTRSISHAAARVVNRDWVGRWRDGHADLAAGFEGDPLFGFADGYPLLVANQASLDAAERDDCRPRGAHRLLRWTAFARTLWWTATTWRAYEEDHAALLARGDDIRLALVKPCTRCSIPDVDQVTRAAGRSSPA